ncbi:helix-turn-helix domain-containing protein [Lactococcus lactis]|uniref:XRE family transcriptional regulator n=1 Tax=Lactococcus lactis TaxID=1358 RepID=UPI003D2DC3A7
MNLSERLKELRTEKKLTQKQIALKLNVAYQVYQRWEKGERQPKKESIENLANVFNVSVGYLLGETNIKSGSEIDEIMEKLKVPRQQRTIQFAKKQLIEQTEEDKIVHLYNSLIPYEVEEEQALSAGRGEVYTDEVGKEVVYWDKDIKHDRAIVIRGNSMEPDYHYGQIALIRYQSYVDINGDIYAIDDVERGLAYIKSVYVEDDYIRLISLNDDIDFEGNRLFPDILLPRDENTRIIGKVIEAFTPIEKV